MGLAEQALGAFVDSEAHLGEALAVPADPWVVAQRAVLDEALTAVRAHLGQLDVRCAQVGVQLRVDGRDHGTLPLAHPMRLLPGTVVVSLSAPGYAPNTRSVTVSAGQLSRETFELAPLTALAEPNFTLPTPSSTAGDSTTPEQIPSTVQPSGRATESERASRRDRHAESGGSALPAVGWVASGVGLVGVGLGIYFYTQRADAVATYNDDSLCSFGGLSREERCGSYARDARSAQTLMTVSFVAGGVLLAGGLGLALFGGSSDDAATDERASVACSPLLGSVVGAACEGRF